MLQFQKRLTRTNKQTGTERNKAFDLLDALTKSGALEIEHASLHVIIASTHCFDKSLMETVIQDNVNPIEKVERSSLIVASTIHNVAPMSLISAEQVERVGNFSPMLLLDGQKSSSKDKEALPVLQPVSLQQ